MQHLIFCSTRFISFRYIFITQNTTRIIIIRIFIIFSESISTSLIQSSCIMFEFSSFKSQRLEIILAVKSSKDPVLSIDKTLQIVIYLFKEMFSLALRIFSSYSVYRFRRKNQQTHGFLHMFSVTDTTEN